MNIQLKEIILWPQNKELDIKTINFVEGKVNVIHGYLKRENLNSPYNRLLFMCQ